MNVRLVGAMRSEPERVFLTRLLLYLSVMLVPNFSFGQDGSPQYVFPQDVYEQGQPIYIPARDDVEYGQFKFYDLSRLDQGRVGSAYLYVDLDKTENAVGFREEDSAEAFRRVLGGPNGVRRLIGYEFSGRLKTGGGGVKQIGMFWMVWPQPGREVVSISSNRIEAGDELTITVSGLEALRAGYMDKARSETGIKLELVRLGGVEPGGAILTDQLDYAQFHNGDLHVAYGDVLEKDQVTRSVTLNAVGHYQVRLVARTGAIIDREDVDVLPPGSDAEIVVAREHGRTVIRATDPTGWSEGQGFDTRMVAFASGNPLEQDPSSYRRHGMGFIGPASATAGSDRTVLEYEVLDYEGFEPVPAEAWLLWHQPFSEHGRHQVIGRVNVNVEVPEMIALDDPRVLQPGDVALVPEEGADYTVGNRITFRLEDTGSHDLGTAYIRGVVVSRPALGRFCKETIGNIGLPQPASDFDDFSQAPDMMRFDADGSLAITLPEQPDKLQVIAYQVSRGGVRGLIQPIAVFPIDTILPYYDDAIGTPAPLEHFKPLKFTYSGLDYLPGSNWSQETKYAIQLWQSALRIGDTVTTPAFMIQKEFLLGDLRSGGELPMMPLAVGLYELRLVRFSSADGSPAVHVLARTQFDIPPPPEAPVLPEAYELVREPLGDDMYVAAGDPRRSLAARWPEDREACLSPAVAASAEAPVLKLVEWFGGRDGGYRSARKVFPGYPYHYELSAAQETRDEFVHDLGALGEITFYRTAEGSPLYRSGPVVFLKADQP
jgi:hypothetical protein